MKIQLNRQIGYTESWTSTVMIACILGIVFCFILIFLQPFDTYSSQMSNKTLKLAGYFFPIAISIVTIHVFENFWFKTKEKWLLYHEIIVMGFGTILITLLSFIYLNNLVNPSAVPWSDFFTWFKFFGLPFAPILLLLWGYLRFRFSKIKLNSMSVEKEKTYTITGNNSNEEHTFLWSDFLVAKSQSNYIEVYVRDAHENHARKIIIRNTLSKLITQLPEAVQVHRSYIINIDYLEELHGNVRKGWCSIKGFKEEVPVSPKHFRAIKNRVE